ncbi:MAG: GAF domain-containing protein, partial [Anaerolineaceae bacterium]|nr:GAF domain-containing protein [Anaerolineaceae bacterium]
VAAQHPELYYAYIGEAQSTYQLKSEKLVYDYMLQEFRASGDTEMVQKLEDAPVTLENGTPAGYLAVRDVAMHRLGIGTTHDMKSIVTGLFLPSLTFREYTLMEKVNLWRGKARNGVSVIWDASLYTDLSLHVTESDIPIYFLEGEDRLVLHASAGYDEDSRTQESIKVGEGIVGAAALDRRPIRLNDIRTDPRYIPVDPRTASELAVPILFNEQLLGILNIESYKIAAYDENDQEILATLGNNLASIIANTQLVEQVRVQVERQQKLYEITSKIRRSTDLRVILETSAAEIGKLLHANSVKVQVNPEQTNGSHQEGEA